jgi:hypothetical protein
VLELGGSVIDQMSIDGRQTITCLAMFTGAVTAIINPDELTLGYSSSRSRIALDPVWSDADAVYAQRHVIDVSALEPVVVVPPSPAHTRDLKDYIGTEVQVGYLGSCAGAARAFGARGLSAACGAHQPGDHAAGCGRGLDHRFGGCRRFCFIAILRLLLWPYWCHVGGAKGGLDRYP